MTRLRTTEPLRVEEEDAGLDGDRAARVQPSTVTPEMSTVSGAAGRADDGDDVAEGADACGVGRASPGLGDRAAAA